MSRIGRMPVPIPSGATVAQAGQQVEVKGPKGRLLVPLPDGISLEIADGEAELWWAYVVKVLDLLLGVGVREVSIPDGDLQLVLADPDKVEVIDMEDEPVLAWPAIVACLLAVLIAFAITFLPRAKRRT